MKAGDAARQSARDRDDASRTQGVRETPLGRRGGGSNELPVWMSTAEAQWRQRLFIVGGLVSGLIIAAAVVGHWMSREPSEALPSATSAQQETSKSVGEHRGGRETTEAADKPSTEFAASEAREQDFQETEEKVPAGKSSEALASASLIERPTAGAAAETADPAEASVEQAVRGGERQEAAPATGEAPMPDGQADAQRVAEARAADEDHHRRLAGGLLSYHDAQGAFPPSAGGIVQLAPESRLSWIALLLSYYGRPAWQEKLNFRRSWSDPKNQPITREPLELVLNPLIERKQTDDGYPVTHYAGISGVGADAARLPANHPRAGLFGDRRRVTRGMVVDGLSNTIALMGVSDGLGPWSAGGPPTVRALTTEPYINGPDGFGSGRPDGVVAAMADGSVRFLSKEIDPRVLEQMATIAGERGDRTVPGAVPDRRSVATDRPMRTATKPGNRDRAAGAAAMRDLRDGRIDEDRSKGEMRTAEAEVGRDGGQSGANDTAQADSPTGDERAEMTPPEWLARLDRPIDEIELSGVRLSELMQLLGDLAAAPIRLDVDALNHRGVTPDTKVSLQMQGATVRQMLEKIASQLNATVEIRADGVVFSAGKPAGPSGAVGQGN